MFARRPALPGMPRTAAAALAVVTATGLVVAAAGPASAATAVSQDVSGSTAGSALMLTVNLPGGAATKIVLAFDPVTGKVGKTVSTTTASGEATVLRGTLGGQAQDSGTSAAKLPSPLNASNNPTGGIADGLKGTPLEGLLKVELLPTSAAVTAAPTSTSKAAVANLGIGLPAALASALAPLTGPLQAEVNGVLAALAAASATPVAAICSGTTAAVTALDPATSALNSALGALPIPVPVAGLLNGTTVDAVCGLSDTLTKLNAALQTALSSLTGDSGVLGTGAITSSQSITRSGASTTSSATASIAALTLLGQKPFAAAGVLQTTATATAAGTAGSSKATVDSTVAGLTGGTVDPFLQIRATIQGIRDSFVGKGALPAELSTEFDALFNLLNAALAPVGVTVFKLDDSADSKALGACPTALTGTLTGTFKAPDGTCAAAATRGVGISLNLPAALATPLMVNGPLVELEIVPTAATASVRDLPPVVVPAAAPGGGSLPVTGLGGDLGGMAVLLLAAAALLRRGRRLTVG